MENRLIFVTAEQARSLEGMKSEQMDGLSPELQDAARKLAQMGNLKANPGGNAAANRLKEIGKNPDTPPGEQENIEQLLVERQAAIDAREANINPETTARLNAVNGKVKNILKRAEERIKERCRLDEELKTMGSLADADKMFKDVKIAINSKSKGGHTYFEWRPGGTSGNLEGFRQLGIPNGKKFLAEMKKALTAFSGGTEALRDKLINNKDVPDSWKDEKKWPDGKIDWVWINENLGEMKLSAAKYDLFKSQNEHELNKKGVILMNENAFRKLSRHERNDYTQKMTAEAERVGLENAEQLKSMELAEGAETQALQTSNQEAINKEVEKTDKTAEDLSGNLRRFTQDYKLEAKTTTALEDMKKPDASDTATKATSLREQAQKNAGKSLWEQLKEKAGFGENKEAQAADDYFETKSEQPEQKTVEKKDPEAELREKARRQAAGEILGEKGAADTYKKALGVKEGTSLEDMKKLNELLLSQKFDTETLKTKLTPEMKRVLERNKADDAEKMKKAA